MNLKQIFVLIVFALFAKSSFAAHLMGGEITWKALGGDSYQFSLIIYRDCNGADIIDPTLQLRVWNHPSVTTIDCDLFSTTDLSPDCNEVPGSPSEIDCGVGPSGGSGPGAIQQYIYRSAPVVLAGTPPAAGWAFTYDSFSRNWDIDNITDPFSYGFTLSSVMYALPSPGEDSSPSFAQDPYMLLCSGTAFNFDANAVDDDNDSMVFSWGVPLDHFPAGAFNPPVNPAPVPFNPGYSFNNPTPDASFDAGNVAATMNSETGSISFTSNTVGNYGFGQRIDTYRDGQLIATINRESQLIIIPCPGYVNTQPEIIPPFAGGTSYEAEFFAGDIINFDIVLEDLELLQDGSPQNVTLIPTGDYFGTGLTDPTSGCEYTPCATLDTSPIIVGEQGLTTNFNWETNCDHLLDADGVQLEEKVYNFVLNAQDDYCSVPGRTNKTIRITLKNKSALTKATLNCVDVLAGGDVNLSWTPAVDPDGSFESYEIWSLEEGFLATIPAIGTNNFIVVGAGADALSKNYYIKTKYGCDGGLEKSSDTLTSMFMVLTDLADGRITLDWNDTHIPIHDGESGTQQIYREYPVGVWVLRDEVPYGTNTYLDTIDVCSAFLNYEIRVDHEAGCTSTSNEQGAFLTDMSAPAIPVIDSVSVNSITGEVDVSWNRNSQEDTYGYIIFIFMDDVWTPVDTVYGIDNTTYSYTGTLSGIKPEDYRIAAFDSCFTALMPPTYQTSALSEGHTTIFLTEEYDLCAKTIDLAWTPYKGFIEEVEKYDIFLSIDGAPFERIKTVTTGILKYTYNKVEYEKEHCFVVRVTSVNGTTASSNKVCRFADPPSAPAFHYLAAASHTLGNEVELALYTDVTAAVAGYEIEVKSPYDSDFQSIMTFDVLPTSFMSFYDENVFPERGAYQYRINLIDSCGRIGEVTNVATTSFLQVSTDHVSMKHTLSWSRYLGFNGAITAYNVYRGENGVFDDEPIATTLPGVRSYVDDVSEYTATQGQFCYRVEAIEGPNSYGFNETAFSNTVCAIIDPLVYIPNAFIVHGENPVFLPIVSLYDFSSYELNIYNRWGESIFYSVDANEGWDGTNQSLGGFHQEGVYVYHLKIKDRDEKAYDFRGTVTLLIDAP
jgi:hypothetical protein